MLIFGDGLYLRKSPDASKQHKSGCSKSLFRFATY